MKISPLIVLLALPCAYFAAGADDGPLSGTFAAAQETLPVISMRDTAVYFPVDAVGRPLAGNVEVRGFILDQSWPRDKTASPVDFLYQRLP